MGNPHGSGSALGRDLNHRRRSIVEVNEEAGEVTVTLTDLRLPDLDNGMLEDKPPKKTRNP